MGGLAEATEIYFFQRGYVEGGAGPATRLTDAAVAAFTRTRPEIHVRIVGIPWGREGDLKLRSALLARRRIDCFRLAHDELASFFPRRGRLLSPIDPYLTPADRADFDPNTLAAVSREGHIWAWPLWSTALALVANRAVLEARGIAPLVGRPWTWAEFTEVLRRVNDPSASGKRIYGLNAAARPPLFEWAPLLMAHCGPIFREGESPAPNGSLPLAPGLAGALAKVRAWRDAGLLAPNFGVDGDMAAQAGFMDGRCAFLLTSPGFIRKLIGRDVPFLVLPPPTGEAQQPITTGALGCFAVVDSGDPARIAAAHGLARYLTSPEVARDVPGWYLAPPARASIESFYDEPAYRPLTTILPTARYLIPPVSVGFMNGTLIPRLQAAILGQVTPERAVNEIQQAARRQKLD